MQNQVSTPTEAVAFLTKDIQNVEAKPYMRGMLLKSMEALGFTEGESLEAIDAVVPERTLQ